MRSIGVYRQFLEEIILLKKKEDNFVANLPTIYEDFQNKVTNLYVEHPEVKRIWSRLDRNRKIKRAGNNSDDSPINLFIEGYSGAGKTQCAKISSS